MNPILNAPTNTRWPFIPWPGRRYRIYLKGTNQALHTYEETNFYLAPIHSPPSNHSLWLVGEENGWFTLFNVGQSVWLQHDGEGNMKANFDGPGENYHIVTRSHPQGGTQILMPLNSNKLAVVSVNNTGGAVSCQIGGSSVWEFVETEGQ